MKGKSWHKSTKLNINCDPQAKTTQDCYAAYYDYGYMPKLEDFLELGAEAADRIYIDQEEPFHSDNWSSDGKTILKVYKTRAATEEEIAERRSFFEERERQANAERWEEYLQLVEDVEAGVFGPPEEFDAVRKRREETREERKEVWKKRQKLRISRKIDAMREELSED